MIPRLNTRRILGLFVANFLGASLYVSLSLVVMDRARRAGVTPRSFQWNPAYWVFLLFLVLNAAWAIVVLASPRPHRWDFYGFVWGVWIFAVFLGSGLASI
jgi:hypothetical protein